MSWEEETQQEIFDKAEAKCDKLVKKIIEDKKWVMRRDPISNLIGWIQRLEYRLEGKKIKEWYHIDEDRCIMCKKCIKYCPVGNLSIEEKNRQSEIMFDDDCISSMRCFNFCPEDAIIIMKRTGDSEKHLRFRNQIPNFKFSKVKT